MTGRRRYLCSNCRTNTKLVDYDRPDVIRTSCDLCGDDKLRRWLAIGSVAHHSQSREEVPA